MIQRIQSLFLFLIDIVLVVLLFVPFLKAHLPGNPVALTSFTLMDYPSALVGQVVLCIVAGAGVVTFRNRKLQMRICIAGMFLSVVYTCFLAIIPTILNEAGAQIEHHVGAGTWISLANFFLFFLAWKFVKKDEELVKSMDRIR
jgi:hypothetical protein